MAIAAFGPCLFVAPLVFVLLLLAIPLWPVAILLFSVLWPLAWLSEQVCRLLGIRAFAGATQRAARGLRVAVRPWLLFAKRS